MPLCYVQVSNKLGCALAGYEHVQALGGSLQSIAAAKAGIMKAGRPVVVAQQRHPQAMQVRIQIQTGNYMPRPQAFPGVFRLNWDRYMRAAPRPYSAFFYMPSSTVQFQFSVYMPSSQACPRALKLDWVGAAHSLFLQCDRAASRMAI